MSKVKQWLPILDWLPNYNKSNIKGDVSAGLTVGVMLIPQGMAYSMLAGLPPIYGLYASIVPLLIYAIFGTSRQLAVGPVAMVALLVAAGVGELAEGGSGEYITLAIALALMVGVIQFAMGLFRLGFLVNFLSHPVIAGFTSAAALIIGFSQLKHLMGINIPRSNHVHEIIINAAENIGATNLPTLLIGVGGVLLLLAVKRFKLPIPGPLLLVVLSVLVVWVFGLQEVGVKIVGTVPEGLPAIGVPAFKLDQLQTLLPIALTIAFVSYMESIAVAKAVQSKHKDYEVKPNQELIGLGLANVAGSFFQAFPTTGGFSRTAVNDQSGAKTGLASIISAGLIALTLLFLTPLFYYLPNAVLASVIMVAVFGLIDIKEAKFLWKADRSDFWMMIATFAGTLFLGIEEGIAIGAILSLVIVIYQTSKPDVIKLGKVPGASYYKNLTRFRKLEVRDDLLIVRLDARLYYANIDHFIQTIKKMVSEHEGELKALVLDADSINGIDSSGIHAIKDLIDDCKSRNLTLLMTSVKGVVRDAFERTGVHDELGRDHFFMRVQNAVDYLDHKQEETLLDYTLQHNVLVEE
jgi:SulP family sulfate permease